MDEYKISQAEINENNVKSAADLVSAEDYGGNAREVKGIFDKLPELIVARFNAFIDSVIAKFTGYYTKEETDQAINNKVTDLGAGDMAKAVYDANGDGIVDKAENADLLRGYWLSQYDADGNKTGELYAHYYEDSETGLPVGGQPEDFEEKAVLYVPQELTEEQKAVARENIGVEEGKYTLVHEVTTTDAVNTLSYTCNTKNLFFDVVSPANNEGSNASGIVKINSGPAVLWTEKMTSHNESRSLSAKFYIENGMFTVRDESAKPEGTSKLDYREFYRYGTAQGELFVENITKIEIVLLNSRVFPIGTTLKVYEVK